MWLGMLAAAVAQVAPAAAAPLNALNAPLLAYLEWVAQLMASVPLASLPVRMPDPLLIAALVVAALLAVRRAARRGRRGAGGGRGGAPRAARRWAGALGLLAVAAVVLLARRDPVAAPPAPGELVVSFLAVGQGDATLLQHGGASVLVDAGPPGGPIVARLREAGVRRLDALVLTHASADHDGGAARVLRAFPTRLLLDGGERTRRTPGLRAAAALARARGIRRCRRTPGRSCAPGRSSCGCSGPIARGPRPPTRTRTCARPSCTSATARSTSCSAPTRSPRSWASLSCRAWRR